MISEQLIKQFLDLLMVIIRFLPAMPTEASQFDAVFYAFKTINSVLDVSFLFVNILVLVNLSMSIWLSKFAIEIAYKIWMGIKW